MARRPNSFHVKCPYCGYLLLVVGPELTTHQEGDNTILTATAQIEVHQCAQKDAAEAALKALVDSSLKMVEESVYGTTESTL